MGGVRTAGDMVLRMQLLKGMKIDAAKAYVADKLGITLDEMADSTFMTEFRKDKGYGFQMPYADAVIGMEAKVRIAKVLDIPINSVTRFFEKAQCC